MHVKMGNIGGIDVNFLTPRDVLPVLQGWRDAGRRGYVVLTNPHSIMMCRRDAKMNDATRGANLILPDGVGVIVAARLLGYGRRGRVPGPTLMLEMCNAGRQAGLRHFFYGGADGVAAGLAETMARRFAGLQIAGTLCPPFRELSEDEDASIVEQINSTKPDVLWVGLGAPKQEKWMLEHLGRIHATAMIGVGAAFDFHSGRVPWAPAWMRRTGIEWAYRLVQEPKRMWKRNLDSPRFLASIIGQAIDRNWSRSGSDGDAVEPGYGRILQNKKA